MAEAFARTSNILDCADTTGVEASALTVPSISKRIKRFFHIPVFRRPCVPPLPYRPRAGLAVVPREPTRRKPKVFIHF